MFRTECPLGINADVSLGTHLTAIFPASDRNALRQSITGNSEAGLHKSFSTYDCNFFLLPENGLFSLQGERLINTKNYKDPEVLRHHLMSLLRDEPRLPRER